jgi:hypothetical protein
MSVWHHNRDKWGGGGDNDYGVNKLFKNME